MCGIIGILGSKKNKKFNIEVLNHRGPDNAQVWESNDMDFPIILGHTRLAILGLNQEGNQPMQSLDGNHIIIYNGEIYNFIELRFYLEKKGYIFCTNTDTEVLLYGLIDEGYKFMLRCNGMWSFCLWNRTDNSALFGRDRFGKKPFFYTWLKDGSFAFASEMKGLYPLMDTVQPSSNIDKHFKFLFDYEYSEDCVIEGVKRIPPGFFGEYRDKRMVVKRWWNTLDHLVTVPIRYEDQVEQWKELFIDAVRIRMRADVKIGTALSGGLDSSAVFSTMAYLARNEKNGDRQAVDWQHGFCAHYPNSSLDEVKWARKVTQSIGVNLDEVKIDPMDCGWTVKEAFYQVEDPYLTLPLPMLATYSSISKKGIKVTLDGHGADELFCGYGHILFALRDANPREFAEILAIDKSTRTGDFFLDLDNFRWNWLKHRSKTILREKTQVPRKFLKRLIKGEGNLNDLKWDDQNHPNYRSMDALNKKLYEIFHITILPTLLRNYDRYSMASGVEIRMPFLDWRLVTYSFSLPWQSKVGGGFTKRIMRDALTGILTDSVRERRDKIGWNAPLHEWLRGSMKNEIEHLFHDAEFKNSAYEDWVTFKNIKEPSFYDGQKIWEKMMPFIWKNSFLHKS